MKKKAPTKTPAHDGKLEERVAKLCEKVEALVVELAKLTERLDRQIKILTDEGAERLQKQLVLEANVEKNVVKAAAAQITTDQIVGALDDKVTRLGDRLIEERQERLASSTPPPMPPKEKA